MRVAYARQVGASRSAKIRNWVAEAQPETAGAKCCWQAMSSACAASLSAGLHVSWSKVQQRQPLTGPKPRHYRRPRLPVATRPGRQVLSSQASAHNRSMLPDTTSRAREKKR